MVQPWALGWRLMLQSDQEELKFVLEVVDAHQPRRFNRTRRN